MNVEASNLTRNVQRLRWLVPILFSVSGLLYVSFETLVQHQHDVPHTQSQVLTSVLLLSVLGPAATYAGLSWVLNGTRRLDSADASLRRQNRQLAILNEVGRLANQALDPDEVLSQSLEGLLRLMDLEIGVIWLREGDLLRLKAARGVSREFMVQEQSFPLNGCFCGDVVTDDQLLSLQDLHQVRDLSGGECACERFAFGVGVPIRTQGEVVGVLEIASNTPYELDRGELEMLETVGHYIGLAVEKAQLNQRMAQMNAELEEAVDERTSELLATQDELAQSASILRRLLINERRVEEKTRAAIAQDLHDGVRQLVVGALFESQAIREAVRHSPEAADRELEALDEILQRLEKEMRAAIYSLRPAKLDSHGLVSAVQECAAMFERTTGRPCHLEARGEPRRLADELEVAALRIVQEALNNIRTHAQASEARVVLEFSDEKLDVSVSDDGVGFDHSQAPAVSGGELPPNETNLGLMGMRERAESLNGQLEIQSNNGRGTRIRFSLPIAEGAA